MKAGEGWNRDQGGQTGLCLLPLVQSPGQVNQLFPCFGSCIFGLFWGFCLFVWLLREFCRWPPKNDMKRQQTANNREVCTFTYNTKHVSKVSDQKTYFIYDT